MNIARSAAAWDVVQVLLPYYTNTNTSAKGGMTDES